MADPIDPKHHEFMNQLAHVLDELFNPEHFAVAEGLPRPEKKMAFFLAAFEFNTNGEEGRFNYISNADRLDVRVLLKEMTARFEGQPEVSGNA